MRKTVYLIVALSAMLNLSCTNNELTEVHSTLPVEHSPSLSRSAGSFNYEDYVLLERTVMPRSGGTFQGTAVYMNTGFPLYIFWDFDFEDYNLYAYINGVNPCGQLSWIGDYWTEDYWQGGGYYEALYQLSHVSSYQSASTRSRFDFVIKCDFSRYANNDDYNPWTDFRHVAFHVVFYPETRQYSCDVIEEGDRPWAAIDREV